MSHKRLWLSTWAAVSVLWVMYWIGMSLALGVETIREMIANLGWPLLVGALTLSIPATLYLIGSMVACIACSCKDSAIKS